MSESDVNLSNYENDTRLNKLVDSAISQRKIEDEQLRSYCNNIMSKRDRKMIVSCSQEYREWNKRKITMTFDSFLGQNLWRLCILRAFEMHDIFNHLKVKQNTISFEIKIEDVEKVFNILTPLTQRTQFVDENGQNSSQCTTPFSDSLEPLNSLIKSVLDKEGDENEKLIRYWEEMKIEKMKRLPSWSFTFNKTNYNDETNLRISSDTSPVTTLWAACIVIGLSELEMKETSTSFYSRSKSFGFEMRSKDMGRVLEFLKPLATRMQFETLIIENTQLDVIAHCLNFIECGSVETLTLRPGDINYMHLGGRFFVSSSKHSRCYKVRYPQDGELKPLSISVIKQLLSKMCNYIEIHDPDPVLTPAEVENLVQFFHHMDKKVAIELTINSDAMNLNIGEYYISSVEDWGNQIVIEHLHMEKSLFDMFCEMSSVHFKFAYKHKNHRFGPTLHDAEMLSEIKNRVAKITDKTDNRLCWIEKGPEMNVVHPLETTADLREAMDHAKKEADKSARQPPCVHLDISSAPVPRPAASPQTSCALYAQISRQLIRAEHREELRKYSEESGHIVRNFPPRKPRTLVRKPAMSSPLTSLAPPVVETDRPWAPSAPIPIPARRPNNLSDFPYDSIGNPFTLSRDLFSEEEEEPSTIKKDKLFFGPLPDFTTFSRDLISEEEVYSDKENHFENSEQPSDSFVQAREALTRSLRFGHSAAPPSPPPSPLPSPPLDRFSRQPTAAERRRELFSSRFESRRTDRESNPFSASLRNRYSSLDLHSSSRDSGMSIISNKYSLLNVSESSSLESDEGIGGEFFEKPARHRWLLLQNGANDCFLNAALQYLRRMRDLSTALGERDRPEELDEKQERKEHVLAMLECILQKEGRVNPRKFRQALPTVISGLERNFLYTQQDAYEILTQIFDDVIPESIAKKFFIESCSRKRCRDSMSCKGNEKAQPGAIHYQHIERQNQIVDLEALLSSEWTAVDGTTEPRHCSECCYCCIANKENSEHDEDKCTECKANKRPYVEEQCFNFKGDSNYALVAFNILHPGERMDWALAENCNMDGMKLMGRYWRAVSVIKHSGSAFMNYSRGHYVTYTRQDDDKWYLHDDDAIPYSIGDQYHPVTGPPYTPAITFMQGVLAILFEKIV